MYGINFLGEVVTSMRTTRDTKGMFADELETMMERMPLSKVRIADLCARCGVERRVFYYHFKDKYDLVAWMFERDYLAASGEFAPYTQGLYAEAHRRLWARRAFYRRAFEEDSQNSIYRYLLDLSANANEKALKRHLGVTVLADEMAFVARHFAHGNVGCVVDWLRGTLNMSAESLASCMFAAMPKILCDAYAASSRLE